jgi:hypothetical protein
VLSNLCPSHAPRRGFLVALAVVILCSGRPSRAEEGLIRLENSSYIVEFERGHGKLTRFYDKRSRTELISEPRLASNFQLLIPLPKLEGNYVLGGEQKLTTYIRHDDSLVLTWKGPLTNPKGTYDVDVTMRVVLDGPSAEIRLSLANRSDYGIDEIWYPILGGITGVGSREDTQETINYSGWTTKTHLFQHFPSRGEALGIPFAEAYWSYPGMVMPWLDLSNQRLGRGVYIGVHDPVSRYKTLRFELHPGMANREGDNWPTKEEMRSDEPVGVLTHWTLYPYIKPGATFDGPPIHIEFHDGDWHAAARMYRDWFKSSFKLADTSRNWMYNELGFLDSMFLLPEGNVKFRFQDIPRWAGAAQKYGLTSVLISGWNVGGHDGGYPQYDPDPRLGTWEDLKAGIDECHRNGIKVFFFVNVQPAEIGTEWYNNELNKFRQQSKYGEPRNSGWGMGSLGARIGFTRRPLQDMSSGVPEFRQIIVRQMEHLARIGADGIHIDKLCPTGMDFNPLLKLSPDQAITQGQLAAVREIQTACGAIQPDFSISAECPWDRLLEYTGVGWSWHQPGGQHTPVFKYTFPELYLPTVAAQQPYDYTAVNNAMRYGYQIFVGPGNYTEPMDYPPFRTLAEYIKEVLRLRKELQPMIYSGEFLDTLEVELSGSEETGYGVFRNRQSGKHACVLVNYDRKSHTMALSRFENSRGGSVRIYAPFMSVRAAKLPVTVQLPAERFAVVVEE